MVPPVARKLGRGLICFLLGVVLASMALMLLTRWEGWVERTFIFFPTRRILSFPISAIVLNPALNASLSSSHGSAN